MKKIFLSIIFAIVSAFTFAQTMYVCKGGNYTAVDITDGLEISLTEGIDSITFYEPQFDNPSLTKDYTVEIAATENGTVTSDVSEAQAGETVTLTVTPAEGYEFETLTVTCGEDGTDVDVAATEDEGVYTFTMPEGNVTVSATFAEIPQEVVYTVNIAGSENGTVTSDVSEAQAGETVTLTITPVDGYEMETLTVTCGEDSAKVEVAATEDEGVYTFTMPESDVTVSATFAEISEEKNYYWYVGNTDPATMTSISPIASGTETGWRNIGKTIPKYTLTSPLYTANNGTITLKRGNYAYVAIPADAPNLKIRDSFGNELTSVWETQSSTKTLEGVIYTIYKSKITTLPSLSAIICEN